MPRRFLGANKRLEVDPVILQAAVQEVLDGQGLRKTASAYKIPRSTLGRHVQWKREGREVSLVEVFGNRHAGSQVFTAVEEEALVKYVIICVKMHYGLSRVKIKEFAYQFAVANKKTFPKNWEERKMAGNEWLLGFLSRHKNLADRTPEATSIARSMAFNRFNVTLFYDNLDNAMKKYNFPPDKIYNLDETGVTTVQKPVKILAEKGTKQVSRVTSAERGELVTMCATVSAVGHSVPPFFIFPRVYYKENIMLKNAPVGSAGTANPSGWMTGEIFIQVLEHFVRFTRCSKDSPVLLTLDNHRSHISLEVVNFARENGIHILTLPPHCSNKLQVLDVSVFGPFKTYYNAAVDSYMTRNPGKTVTIYEICELVGVAYSSAFSINNIISGFQKTGIYPFNRNLFQDADFAPSDVTDQPDPSSARIQPSTSQSPSYDPAPASIPTMSPTSTPKSQIPDPTVDTPLLPIPGPSRSFVTPEDVRPFPKAPPRGQKRKSRSQASRMVTSTPEKTKIEEEAAKKNKMRPAKPKPAKPKPDVSKCRKNLVKALHADLHSSDDDDPDDITSGESSDFYESPEEDPTPLTEFNPESDTDSLKPGMFVLAKFVGGKRKKSTFLYVCSIQKSPTVNDEGQVDVEIMSFISQDREKKNFVPRVDDVSDISVNNIVALLPDPSLIVKGERVSYVFRHPIKEVKEG